MQNITNIYANRNSKRILRAPSSPNIFSWLFLFLKHLFIWKREREREREWAYVEVRGHLCWHHFVSLAVSVTLLCLWTLQEILSHLPTGMLGLQVCAVWHFAWVPGMEHSSQVFRADAFPWERSFQPKATPNFHPTLCPWLGGFGSKAWMSPHVIIHMWIYDW